MSEREPKVDKAEWEKFSSLLGSLPLDKCRREICNSVTGEFGWRAPEGKVFRINGQFDVFFDQSSEEPDYFTMPQPSAEKLTVDFAEEYKKFLIKTDGDENRALILLVESMDGFYGPPLYGTDEMPLSFFEGKWLVIYPDIRQEPDKNKNSSLGTPNLKIKGDVDAWAKKEYLQSISDIAPQSSMITSVLFDSQIIVEHWQQDYAEAVLDKCKIELVDSSEEKKEFYIPEQQSNLSLYLPDGTRRKGARSDNEFAVVISERPSEEQKTQLTDFNKHNVNLLFVPRFGSDLVVARNETKLIIPGKGKKDRK